MYLNGIKYSSNPQCVKASFIQKRIPPPVSLWTVNLAGLNLTCETFMANKRKYLAHCLCEYWYALTVEAIGTLSTTMVGRTAPQASYWTTILIPRVRCGSLQTMVGTRNRVKHRSQGLDLTTRQIPSPRLIYFTPEITSAIAPLKLEIAPEYLLITIQ